VCLLVKGPHPCACFANRGAWSVCHQSTVGLVREVPPSHPSVLDCLVCVFTCKGGGGAAGALRPMLLWCPIHPSIAYRSRLCAAPMCPMCRDMLFAHLSAGSCISDHASCGGWGRLYCEHIREYRTPMYILVQTLIQTLRQEASPPITDQHPSLYIMRSVKCKCTHKIPRIVHGVSWGLKLHNFVCL